MKVKKYELVRIIDKLKSVVQKNTVHPALGGVLVKEGYLIAANGEITIQVKCEDAEGESFIIPMKAFDLIKNLPEGDVELLHDDKNVVTIKMEKIKNSYQSFPAENFIYSKTDMESGEELTLPGKSFMEAISHVIYAAAEKEPSKPMLEGIYLEGCDGYINLVATDGHVLAWDRIKADGIADLKIIVPKAAAKKLLSMGMDDDVNVSYSANSAKIYVYDEGQAREDILNLMDEYDVKDEFMNDRFDFETIDDVINDILEDFDEDRGIGSKGYDELGKVFSDVWEIVGDIGKQNTNILDLYMLAFKLATDQLQSSQKGGNI